MHTAHAQRVPLLEKGIPYHIEASGPCLYSGKESKMTFDSWFKELIGQECPIRWMSRDLRPMENEIWITPENPKYPKLTGFPHKLVLEQQEKSDYTLVGFSGYGCNSYALYVTDFNGNKSFFLRLPFGGCYGDRKSDAESIIKMLEGFQELNSDRFAHVAFTITNNMDTESLSVRLANQRGWISDMVVETQTFISRPERLPEKILAIARELKKRNSTFSPYLRVAGGLCSGEILNLKEPDILLGRSNDNWIFHSSRVSRRHAILRRESIGVSIEDLNSTNGTTINGAKIEAKKRYSLNRGDMISLAGITLCFCP